MPQLPAGAQSSEFYRLLSGAMISAGEYDSVSTFFRDEFNHYFPDAKWKQLYSVAPENRSGQFTQVIGKRKVPVMASYVSQDADGQLIGSKGFAISTKTMPTMKLAYNFNEQSVEEAEYLARMGARLQSRDIYENFLTDSTALIAGIHTQRSYTGLQVESTGKYLSTSQNNKGGAIGLEFDFNVPEANKKKAGGYGKRGKKKAWSDPAASPVGDLLDMAKYARDRNIIVGVFRMNENTYLQLVEHPDTIRQVMLWQTKGMVLESNITNGIITDDVMQAYLKALRLPPIEVEKWTGFHQCLDPDTQKLIQTPLTAFADNVVLLRPAGMVGTLQWKAPTTLFGTTDNPMHLAEGRMIGIQQVVNSKQKAMQFTAEAKGMLVPDNIDLFLYLDTANAAA